MSHRRFLVLTSLVAACSPPPEPPKAAADSAKACSEMGCDDGLAIELVRPSPWPAGAYRFTLSIDGKAVRCEGALPLPPCDSGPSFHCDDASLTIAESGCALPPGEHAITGLHSTLTEGSEASLLIEHEGSIQATAKLTPSFQTLQPNGPGCEPVCQSASLKLTLR